MIWIPSDPAIRGIQEGDKQVNLLNFKDLLALPFVVSKKGSMFQRPSGPAIRGIQEGEYVSKTFSGPAPRGYPRREIIFCSS